MDEQHPRDRPDVRNVPVARQDEINAALAQQREDIAGVEHLVALAAGAGDGNEVVVTNEDAQVGLGVESVFYPAVVFAADLSLVEIRLRGVHRDERHVRPNALESKARIVAPNASSYRR